MLKKRYVDAGDGFNFPVVDDIKGLNDEDVEEEKNKQKRNNTATQVQSLGLSPHSEGGGCTKHVKLKEKLLQHLL